MGTASLTVSANAVSIDVLSKIASGSVMGTLNRGLTNHTPTMTWLEVIIWLAYVVPKLILFFWAICHKGKSSQASATTQTSETALVDASRHNE